MGNGASSPGYKPTKEDFEKLSASTNFTLEEVQKLWNRFDKLSNSQTADGLIDVDEFQQAMGLKCNGFAKRIFAAFDNDGSEQIDFIEFVTGLSALSPKASAKEKAKFCFNVYDIDKNGFIEKEELHEVLVTSLSENQSVKLSEAQLEMIIDSTYKKMDKKGLGKICFEDFEEESRRNPTILACVTLNLNVLFE